MNVILCLGALVCAVNCLDGLLTGSSGIHEDYRRLGIYGGRNTSITKVAHTVSIWIEDRLVCGGAIINNRWIITSGGCGSAVDPPGMSVLLGSSDGVSGKRCKVDKIVVHPKYGQSILLDYDVSLYKLACEIKYSSKIQPVKLSSNPPKPNTPLIVSGFGATYSGGDSGHLMSGLMKWQTTDFCNKAYKHYSLKWTERMACVYNKGKTTLCNGDWGNPFVKNGTLYCIGIDGAPDGYCTSKANAYICTNVASIADWVRSVIGG